MQHQKGTTYDNTAMLATLDATTQGRASALMARIDKGLTLAGIRALLASRGVSVEGFASDEVYVSFDACPGDACEPALFRR